MEKIAVIKTGGKQYKVKQGQRLKVEKLDGAEGGEVEFGEVLFVSDETGEKVQIGVPHVKDAVVKGKITKQGRARKIDVIKYKPKIRYKRKIGHRQYFTEVEITQI